MNEQFRVAQKIGLMFRPGTAIPDDIKTWAISQLHSNSPALGIRTRDAKVKSWPQSMQPDLEERAIHFRLLQGGLLKNREIIDEKKKKGIRSRAFS